MVCTGYRHRALTPRQEQAVANALAGGASVEALARSHGVTTRTIYRAARRANVPTFTAHVGGFTADFRLEDGYPIQQTPWVPE